MGSRIVRYSPNGDVKGVIELPVSQPTCVAFGGKNLDLLFVTTARDGLSDGELARQPDAGNVLVYKTDFVGIEEPLFKTAG